MNIKNMDKFTHTYMEIISESKDLDMLEDIKKNWAHQHMVLLKKNNSFQKN